MGSDSWTWENLEWKTMLALSSEVTLMTHQMFWSMIKTSQLLMEENIDWWLGHTSLTFFFYDWYWLKRTGTVASLGCTTPRDTRAGELFPGHRADCPTLIFTVGTNGIHGQIMDSLLLTLLPPKQTRVNPVLWLLPLASFLAPGWEAAGTM